MIDDHERTNELEQREVNIATLELGAHTAYLEPMIGAGLLICPRPEDDVPALGKPALERVILPGVGPIDVLRNHASLHVASWDHAMHELYKLGFAPCEDDYGEPMIHGHTADGRTAIAMVTDPETDAAVVSHPTLEEIGHAYSALEAVAGVSPL